MMRSITAAVVVLIAGATWWLQGQTAEGEGTAVWEFATVESLQEYSVGNVKTSTANICYHTSGGCRWETVRVNVDRWGQTHDALAAASARLGERGWEPVAVTVMVPEQRPSILLKRRRPTE